MRVPAKARTLFEEIPSVKRADLDAFIAAISGPSQIDNDLNTIIKV